ncbi:MAG: hypothetical protein ACI8PV_000966 [Dinoroseobacter sp.]|jgi:hypothetical protein
MPAPKHTARKMLDQIEGFRLYLAKAEHDSLKRLDIPEKTSQLYEELLPFAVSLNLETQWSDQFTEILAAAKMDPKASRCGCYSIHQCPVLLELSQVAWQAVLSQRQPNRGGNGGFLGGGGGGGRGGR